MTSSQIGQIEIGSVVLAYSGGVDTSTCIPYLMNELGIPEVTAVTVNLGTTESDPEEVRSKALQSGARRAIVRNVGDEFATRFLMPAIRANLLYQNKYPLGTALGRPLIVEQLVSAAHEFGCKAVAHGSTGLGNDQVRFDLGVRLLDPTLTVLAPARTWGMSREACIDYLAKHNIQVKVGRKSPFSYDENPGGNAIEGGVLEDAWQEAPEECYRMTRSLLDAPNEPEYIVIRFDKGVPVQINGEDLSPLQLIQRMNHIGGNHGYGRIDMIEDRVVHLKTREIYEAPALLALILAHRELESITLLSNVLQTKFILEQQYANLVYAGGWFHPLRDAIEAFVDTTQQYVNGEVRLKFFKGSCTVVGRRANERSLYVRDLATYGEGGLFNQTSAPGFIDIFGLDSAIWSQVNPQTSI